MARFTRTDRMPSACTITRADGVVLIEDARPRVYVPREQRAEESAAPARGIVDTPRMFYVTTKRAADALKGSRNAIRQLRKSTVWGVFATEDAAAAFVAERGLHMVAAIAHV